MEGQYYKIGKVYSLEYTDIPTHHGRGHKMEFQSPGGVGAGWKARGGGAELQEEEALGARPQRLFSD
jgi:hypothetical protein